jgi:hypothetical protein
MAIIAGECIYDIPEQYHNVTLHRWQWRSSAGGDVKMNMETPLEGVPWKLVTQPLDSPTDNYSVTIADDCGSDILLGKGASRDTATVETMFVNNGTDASVRNITRGLHVFVIAAAGASKSGIVNLYMVSPEGSIPINIPIG